MSTDLERAVAQHYGRQGLAERILDGLKAAGVDLERLQPEDLAPVDEFHIGGRPATEDVLGRLGLTQTDHVLDIGCGIGGTVRYMAQKFDCRAVGIDLTPEYVEAARLLTEQTGLADRAEFQVASALDLPFQDATFDAAVSFHVAMNIKDRPKLYAETARVLKPQAQLCIYDVMRGPAGSVRFPTPWAETAETSHLTTPDEMQDLLAQAGFAVNEVEDRSAAGIAFFRQRLAATAEGPPPPLGLHLLMGPSAREKFTNMLQSLEAGAIAPVVMIARREQ